MILVTTALGIIGRGAVLGLNRRGEEVRALVPDEPRRHELEEWFKLQGADMRRVHFALGTFHQPETLPAALQGVDRALLIQSADERQVELESNFIRACQAARIRHLVNLSGIGAALDAPTRLGRMLATTEQEINASGLPYTHLQPHMFLLNQNIRSFASNIQESAELSLPLGEGKVSMLDARDIARAAAAALTTPGHEGETYVLTGPEALTGDDMAQLLSKASEHTIRYVDLPQQEARRRMLAARMHPWLIEDGLVMFSAFRTGVAGGISPDLQKLTGRPGSPFSAFAYDYAWAFRKGDTEGQLSGWLN